uniref:MliC family protein n=1 Tax=Klebsiella pneumoniae TaxID=573 RepID=UPI00132FDF63
EGGKTLDVVYVGDYAVMLQMDELVPLKRAKSASGVRYISARKNYTYELWGKGNDMNLSTHDGGKEQTVLSSCKP